MGSAGGIVVSEKLKLLETALRDYYGSLNELKAGLKAKVPPKPGALIEYEKCTELGLPIVAGGVYNQPYIWLQEIAVIKEVKELFELLDKQSSLNSAP